MIETVFKSAFVRRRMVGSHLGIILPEFVVSLKVRGHAMTCIQAYAQVAEHFSRWLGAQRLERLLPLPPSVARAIANYLRDGRPSTESRALFVRHRAPLGRALAAHHVRGAMRRAFARSGIGVTRVHLLRHTLATELHQKGVGLKALADVLGHQCLETAARYARVNLRELRQAAQPWPEERS